MVVAVATNDMIITSKQIADVQRFKSDLCHHWEISDMGEIHWYLGFEVKCNRNMQSISINQQVYIESVLERFNLTGANLATLPMDPGVQLTKVKGQPTSDEVERMSKIPYAEAISSVLWPAMILRPDIAYGVGVLEQFIQNPAEEHWEVLKRLITYLGGTKALWLTFGGVSGAEIEGYCNADWASQTQQHSISGYSFLMGRGLISWSSKKQSVIALSSTEAKYVALTHAAKEALWLRMFMGELRGKPHGPIKINSDNQGAIALCKDNKFHARTKHIDIRYHFIRESISNEKLSLGYVPTHENISDVFTKALPKAKFCHFIRLLGLSARQNHLA